MFGDYQVCTVKRQLNAKLEVHLRCEQSVEL